MEQKKPNPNKNPTKVFRECSNSNVELVRNVDPHTS